MSIKFNEILANLENTSDLVIGEQTFLNEIIFDEDLQSAILGGTSSNEKPSRDLKMLCLFS